MHLDLSELTQLAPIFRELFKGYHISHRDPELYTQLSSHQDQYRGLFRAMGFELVCDTRGFYYFVPEQVGAQVNKTAQRLALFTFILVEHLADQGRDPLSVLDGGSIGRKSCRRCWRNTATCSSRPRCRPRKNWKRKSCAA